MKLEERTMVRIRGTIGDWPVDLTVELDESEWAQLQVSAPPSASAPVKPASQDDAVWEMTKELLRKAGQMTGPELLGQLQALTGSTASGKRLLVRLRHCSEVKVASGADSPVYSWIV